VTFIAFNPEAFVHVPGAVYTFKTGIPVGAAVDCTVASEKVIDAPLICVVMIYSFLSRADSASR
jgi:hypothetical protein